VAGKATNADADVKKILKTMASDSGPWANKQVAEKAGLDAKAVSGLMGKLKKQGLVDSPVRCKYAITDAGKAELKK
jgi:predicted transcriptional regulator